MNNPKQFKRILLQIIYAVVSLLVVGIVVFAQKLYAIYPMLEPILGVAGLGIEHIVRVIMVSAIIVCWLGSVLLGDKNDYLFVLMLPVVCICLINPVVQHASLDAFNANKVVVTAPMFLYLPVYCILAAKVSMRWKRFICQRVSFVSMMIIGTVLLLVGGVIGTALISVAILCESVFLLFHRANLDHWVSNQEKNKNRTKWLIHNGIQLLILDCAVIYLAYDFGFYSSEKFYAPSDHPIACTISFVIVLILPIWKVIQLFFKNYYFKSVEQLWLTGHIWLTSLLSIYAGCSIDGVVDPMFGSITAVFPACLGSLSFIALLLFSKDSSLLMRIGKVGILLAGIALVSIEPLLIGIQFSLANCLLQVALPIAMLCSGMVGAVRQARNGVFVDAIISKNGNATQL